MYYIIGVIMGYLGHMYVPWICKGGKAAAGLNIAILVESGCMHTSSFSRAH